MLSSYKKSSTRFLSQIRSYPYPSDKYDRSADLSPPVKRAILPAPIARQELSQTPRTERASVSGATATREISEGLPVTASAELHFVIPSTAAALSAAVRMIRTIMEWMAFEHDWIFRTELCLQEALLNAHFHGNEANPSREIRMVCWLAPGKIELDIEDEGAGYNTGQEVSRPFEGEPHGRGLYLIRELMNSVAIHGNGTRIVMSLNKE